MSDKAKIEVIKLNEKLNEKDRRIAELEAQREFFRRKSAELRGENSKISANEEFYKNWDKPKMLSRISELEASLKIFVLTPTFQLTNGVTTTNAIVVFDDDLKKAADILGINIDPHRAHMEMEVKDN